MSVVRISGPGGEKDVATSFNGDVAVANHALDGGGDSGRSNVELFGEVSTDRDCVRLAHLPDDLEVIFLRNAGFIAAQRVSVDLGFGGPSGLLAGAQPVGKRQHSRF